MSKTSSDKSQAPPLLPSTTDSRPKTSADTSLSSLLDRLTQSQPGDGCWKELLKVDIRTRAAFKEVLLRTLACEGVSGYPLGCHQLDGDVPVMVHNGRIYYLRPDDGVLLHDVPELPQEMADTVFKQLHFGSPHPKTFSSTEHGNGDFFLPLGSLVEEATADNGGKKRLTNYCWALNISTDPVSLWLVFDYVKTDPEEDDSTVNLSQIYLNECNEVHAFSYAFEQVPQGHVYLGLDRAWDVLKVFDDVDTDWQPKYAKDAQLEGAKRSWELGSTMKAYALEKPPQGWFKTSLWAEPGKVKV
ncbi:MAG: hypothetical protein Q9207_005656 [Kuettlingeria erythrocarpa]